MPAADAQGRKQQSGAPRVRPVRLEAVKDVVADPNAADPVAQLAIVERVDQLLGRLGPADRALALALLYGCDGDTVRSASARRNSLYRIMQASRELDAEDAEIAQPQHRQDAEHALHHNYATKCRTLFTRTRSGLEEDLDGPEDAPATAAARLDFLRRLEVELGAGGFEALCRAANRNMTEAERERAQQQVREIQAIAAALDA